MVAELRAERAELDHRRHFTEDKKPIELTRAVIQQWTTAHEAEDIETVTARSAISMRTAADNDLFEVG